MNKTIILILVVIAIIIAGGFFIFSFSNNNFVAQNQNEDSQITQEPENGDMNVGTSQPTQPAASPVPQDEPLDVDNDAVVEVATAEGEYVPFSEEAFTANQDKSRVLFFHASWCPTCKAADQEIQQSVDQIPENVVIFKTDYDDEVALKDQYGVTFQHTFVQVDSQGNEVTKWNGGSFDEIVENIEI